MILNGHRLMWILLTFDLPTKTKSESKAASRFRFYLLDQGFEMAQYSVYLRYCSGKNEAQMYINRISTQIPSAGKVDILRFTDKQYEQIISFNAGGRKARKNPNQYVLF
jgi:CRISPR-associated protein Cas2